MVWSLLNPQSVDQVMGWQRPMQDMVFQRDALIGLSGREAPSLASPAAGGMISR